jgi:hypothetical protein
VTCYNHTQCLEPVCILNSPKILAGICPPLKIKFKIVHVCKETEALCVNINYHRYRCMGTEVIGVNANWCIFLTRIVSLKVPKCFNIFSNPVQHVKFPFGWYHKVNMSKVGILSFDLLVPYDPCWFLFFWLLMPLIHGYYHSKNLFVCTGSLKLTCVCVREHESYVRI